MLQAVDRSHKLLTPGEAEGQAFEVLIVISITNNQRRVTTIDPSTYIYDKVGNRK